MEYVVNAPLPSPVNLNDTHNWYQVRAVHEDRDDRVMVCKTCGVEMAETAAEWPCGQQVPRYTLYVEGDEGNDLPLHRRIYRIVVDPLPDGIHENLVKLVGETIHARKAEDDHGAARRGAELAALVNMYILDPEDYH